MKFNYQFQNLVGPVYRGGRLLFHPVSDKLYSPVGHRITCYTLTEHTSLTLATEHCNDISVMTLDSQGKWLVSVDDQGRSLWTHLVSNKVLFQLAFNAKVHDLAFSPCSKYLAVALEGGVLQIWKSPQMTQFQPFELVQSFAPHRDSITALSWSENGQFILTGSEDTTCKVLTFQPDAANKLVPLTLTGHRSKVLMIQQRHDFIYSVSSDGILIKWKWDENKVQLVEKQFLAQLAQLTQAPVACAAMRQDLIVVGFANGVFALFTPELEHLQSLSMSQSSIQSLCINATQQWIALGSEQQELLVWEWQSESYQLKQHGHFNDISAMAYSPDATLLATGTRQGKVKVWQAESALCYVTFDVSQSAITSLTFTSNGRVLLVASGEGAVRAYDLVRYRLFKVLTPPEPETLLSLSVDKSNSIVAAASEHQVYVWSLQSGQLLEVLQGHVAPLSGISFQPQGSLLATWSWDGQIRLYRLFERDSSPEVLQLPPNESVLALAWHPSGLELAVTGRHYEVYVWHIAEAKLMKTLTIKMKRGRRTDQQVTRIHATLDFISYTADGQGLFLCTKEAALQVVLVDLISGVAVRRFALTRHHGWDGTREKLNSRQKRSPSITFQVQDFKVSPMGDAFAVATTEGVLVFGSEKSLVFDPMDLSEEITPALYEQALRQGETLKALLIACRLKEASLALLALKSMTHLPILRQLPRVYFPWLIQALADSFPREKNISQFLKIAATLTECVLKEKDVKLLSVEMHRPMKALLSQIRSFHRDMIELNEETVALLNWMIKK